MKGFALRPYVSPAAAILAQHFGAGAFLVSYRQASEESVLLDLAAVVDRLITLARSGDYRPRG
jgi:hypothetical protein